MKALRFSVSIPKYLTLKGLGTLCRRLYYSGPLATVRLVELPEPGLPSPDWVKIRTRLCGFCATDLNLILLRESPSASPFTSFPCVMGHEICGEIAEVGERAPGFEPGDQVTISPGLHCEIRGIRPVCSACATGLPGNCENFARGNLAPGMIIGLCADIGGGFAPYFVAHRSQLFKLPEGMPAEVGVLIEPLSVGLQAVLENLPGRGEEVLVVGGGVIGCMVIQALGGLETGCRITAIDPSAFAAEQARKAGAHRVMAGGDLFGQAAAGVGATRYRPLLGQEIFMGGFARIYDTVGSPRTLNTGLRCLAAGGTLSLVGIRPRLRLDPTPLWLKHQTIRGVYGCGFHNFRGKRQHLFEIAFTLVREGRVKLEGMVTHKFSLHEFRKMIAVNLDKGRHRAVKTVVAFL